MTDYMIKELLIGLKAYYDNAEGTEKVILSYAIAAAAADAAGGAIPGLAIPAAIVSCFGAIKEHALKLLAKAALANIAANLGGVLIAIFAGMLLPGASILVSAAVAFIAVYLAGIVFLRLILKMARQSCDPYTFRDISDHEMKAALRGITVTKEDLKAAKAVYDDKSR